MKIGEIWECVKPDKERQVELGEKVTITALEDELVFCQASIPHVITFWDRQYFIQIFKKVYLEDQ